MYKRILISMRPKQWYKNTLLFVCIIFSGNIEMGSMWIKLVLAFIYFILISGAKYLINDVLDRNRDKIHPSKSKRPIAAGQLKVSHALIIASILIAGSLAGAYYTINLNFLIISVVYLMLMLLYSLVLKHYQVVDILVISIGFVIRPLAGCYAIDVEISPWLIACTFLLALFLALTKRWQELTTLGDDSTSHRPSLVAISPKLMEQFITIVTGSLIVSYLLYIVELYIVDHGNYMMMTAPFVVYGLFRYLYLMYQRGYAPEPEKMFKDKPMLINLGIWGLIVIAVTLSEVLT